MRTPAGWYADPWQPGHLRYWDGVQWTPATQPAPPVTAVQRLGTPARVLDVPLSAAWPR